jgi:glutathionylspermidine synthase
MRRVINERRLDWQAQVESLGFTYHTIDDELYWDEAGWYEFSMRDVEKIETATNSLHSMCLEAVQVVLDEERWDEFMIPHEFREWIRASWDNDQPTLYGRFDLAWDGQGPIKMLEYNADTPTALFEAAVVQWQWLETRHPELDQFNSLHDRLIDAWRWLLEQGMNKVSFAATKDHEEDFGNITYLRDTASQAGIDTQYLDISSVGYDSRKGTFVDEADLPIVTLFKLYPWEWMLSEDFAPHLLNARTQWIEPPWKMLLSNKALLVILWELFPDSEYLLPASWEPLTGDYVRKPILAREGSNVQLVRHGVVDKITPGPYSGQPEVFQAYSPLYKSSAGHAVIGSWIIGDAASGIGIREDKNPITHNSSRFVPHVIRG